MAPMDTPRDFATDHGGIDAQHRVLFALLRKAEAGIGASHPPDYRALVLDLLKYVVEHFGYEYELMRRNGFPGTDAHHADHQRLTLHVVRFKDRVLNGEDASEALTAFLRGWVDEHIVGFDHGLARFLNERGVGV
jgi:hemerythrin-like metal-binding protein